MGRALEERAKLRASADMVAMQVCVSVCVCVHLMHAHSHAHAHVCCRATVQRRPEKLCFHAPQPMCLRGHLIFTFLNSCAREIHVPDPCTPAPQELVPTRTRLVVQECACGGTSSSSSSTRAPTKPMCLTHARAPRRSWCPRARAWWSGRASTGRWRLSPCSQGTSLPCCPVRVGCLYAAPHVCVLGVGWPLLVLSSQFSLLGVWAPSWTPFCPEGAARQ